MEESSEDDDISWRGFLARELRGWIFLCLSLRHIFTNVVDGSGNNSLMVLIKFFPGGVKQLTQLFVLFFVFVDAEREERSESSILGHETSILVSVIA